MADNKNLIPLEMELSDTVLTKITGMVENSELALPEGYNAGTALRSALLIIKETKDKNGKTALEVCTKASIANALLNMCIQGLDPAKRQCYFIVFGNQLQLFRSYFGTQSALRRAVPSVYKIVADLVHEDDEVEWVTNQFGERHVARIVTDPMENVEKPIKYGFCNIYDREGNLLGSTAMTWKDIQKSWSKTRSGGATQKDFPEEMAKRTLINRACKHILNSSVDSNAAVVAAFNHTTDSEYRQDEVKPAAEKKSVKERYGIKAEDIVEQEPETEEAPGPEDFEDCPFPSDNQPKSEGLFDGMEEVPF